MQQAWADYSTIAKKEHQMLAVWEKLKNIAEVTIEAKGENTHDEGKKAGAVKRAKQEVLDAWDDYADESGDDHDGEDDGGQ